ncbi:MAG: uncharacterized protein H6Q76_2756 [Firmicutes bacterium]|nr:uncharacterized protein [Bacillota bacterium]
MTTQIDIAKLRKTAEGYYRNGDYFCSEAIVKAIKDAFASPLPDDVIAMASGFPVGMVLPEELWQSACFLAEHTLKI